MSRADSELSEAYRDIYGFRERFDVFLGCAFEPSEKADTRFELYDAIGDVVRSLGKEPYIPHQEIILEWPVEKIYDIPNRIVIPTCDIFLAYMGLPSAAGGIMLQNALNSSIPVLYLFENDTVASNVVHVQEDNLGKLEIRLREFYTVDTH